MKLNEIFDMSGDSSSGLDLRLEEVYSSENLLESLNRQNVSGLRGKNISAEFYETRDGDYLSFVSDGSRTEAVAFNKNSVPLSETISNSEKRNLINEYNAKLVTNKRKIGKIIKIALIVVGLGLVSGGVMYLFGPMILSIAGILWNVISFVGSMLGTVGSAIGGLLGFMGNSATGTFAATLFGLLRDVAIAGAVVTGGLITLQIAANIETD